MAHIGPGYGAALQASFPSLLLQLDAELAARTADRGEAEPDVPAPSESGVLAGIQPLGISG